MQNAYLARDWGIRIILLLLFIMTVGQVLAAEVSEQQGVQINGKEVPFMSLMKNLADDSNINLVFLVRVDTPVREISFLDPTPPLQIMESLTKSIGLDFWKDGNTYYVGKRPTATVTPVAAATDVTAVPAALPRTPAVEKIDQPARRSSLLEENESTKSTQFAIRTVELKHMSSTELLYALNGISETLPERGRRKAVDQRIRDIANPTRDLVGETRNSDGAAGRPSPWLRGIVGGSWSRQQSATDQYQYTAPRDFNPGGAPGYTPGGAPGYTPGGAPGYTPGGAPNVPGTPGYNPLTPTTSPITGPLAEFVPAGIRGVVGLIGLNAILVKADSEEAIDQFEALIKLLDQPIKYVLVEAMFVQMTVKDAFSYGVSWQYAGMPISIVSSNGGGDGNFSIHYIKGNIKLALATQITNTSVRVIDAPRVVVPNGSSGSVEASDSIPYVVVSESQDVFGRQVNVPSIESQEFSQGIDVAVTIHPDDSVTLDLQPNLEAPGIEVNIPGGSGSVRATHDFTVETQLRVKSGETMMLGGFISNNELAGTQKDPLLSNIPILGPLLFKSKTHSTNNTETMIFVTPTILKEDTTDFGGMQTLPPLF